MMGGYVLCRYEQLPGATSSPIVTKLHQSYHWPQDKKVIKFWKVKVKDGGGGTICALLSPSSLLSYNFSHNSGDIFINSN